jgi:hypothetical protein
VDALSDTELAQLLELGSQNSQDEQALKMMLAQAERLRQAGRLPGMRDAGRTTHAAHPLEFLASIANQGVAARKDKSAQDLQGEVGARTQRQNAMILRGLTQKPPANPWTPAGMGDDGLQTFPVN